MSVRDLIILGSSSQQPTRGRNHGAYLLRWNDEGFLFDPGEGTQRQFIFANIAPTAVTRIFISHFHGDHCLGLGSMLMRLNLDKVTHPIHCYYPASGKKYFDRLRYGAMYHEVINVIEHPVQKAGVVEDDGRFTIEAQFLSHSVDNIGWRITEADTVKFDKTRLDAHGIRGPLVRTLSEQGYLDTANGRITMADVSHVRPGDTFAVVIDTRPCPEGLLLARNAKMLLCESTYSEEHRDLAFSHFHMTAKQAALLAHEANAQCLVLTHFSARYQDLTPLLVEAQTYFPNTFLAIDLRHIPFPR